MKRLNTSTSRRAGFTLPEMMTTISVFALAAGIVAIVFVTGLTLYAKNVSVNVAHEQTRQAVDRLQRDIHAAISVPVLVDVNRNALNSTGPAEGVAFMLQGSSNLLVAANCAANQNTVQVSGLGSYTPQVGQRFVIPMYQIEADITAVNGNTLTLSNNLGTPVTVTNPSGGANLNIICYVADIVEYVVINGELRFYKNASSNNYNVVSRSLVNSQPFGLPFNPTQ